MIKVGNKFVGVVVDSGSGDSYLVISNKKIRSAHYEKAIKIYRDGNLEIEDYNIDFALEYGLKKLKYNVKVLDFDTHDISRGI